MLSLGFLRFQPGGPQKNDGGLRETSDEWEGYPKSLLAPETLRGGEGKDPKGNLFPAGLPVGPNALVPEASPKVPWRVKTAPKEAN